MRPALASALLAAACLAAMAPKAPAQERQMAQVDSGLARLKRALGPNYFEARQQLTRDFSEATPMTQGWQPTRGSYVILAAGDQTVAGIALRLQGADSAIVVADTSGSRTPRLNVTVAAHGTPYRLIFAPTGCSQFPCYLGVQIMQRR